MHAGCSATPQAATATAATTATAAAAATTKAAVTGKGVGLAWLGIEQHIGHVDSIEA